jgi:hypothetical protein
MRARPVASANFRVALQILVTVALLIPVGSVLNRVFEGTWYVDWRLMLSVGAILAGALLIFFAITDVVDSHSRAKQIHGQRIVFVGVTWIRCTNAAAILMGIAISVGSYREGAEWWIVVLSAAFCLLGYLPWPRAIQISDGEIRQTDWLFRTKRIPLTDVLVAGSDLSTGHTTVFGRNGVRIIHTSNHLGMERFVEELRQRTGKWVS